MEGSKQKTPSLYALELSNSKNKEDREKILNANRIEKLSEPSKMDPKGIEEEMEEEIKSMKAKGSSLAPSIIKLKRDTVILVKRTEKAATNLEKESKLLEENIAHDIVLLDGVDGSEILAKKSVKAILEDRIEDHESRRKALKERASSIDEKKIAEVFAMPVKIRDPHYSVALLTETSKFFKAGLAGGTSEFKSTLARSQKIDLCFLMDATGSMGAYIELTRTKIKEIIQGVKEMYKTAEFYISVVAYRDFGDDDQFQVIDFTTNPSDIELFLSSIVAKGGKDMPEDVNGGFQNVLKELTWRHQTKVLIHFADAPGHGLCEDPKYDSHPNPPSDISWSQIFLNIKSLGIDYYFMKITSQTDLMTTKFQEYWKEKGVIESIKDKNLNPTFDLIAVGKDPKEFVGKIVKPITASVKKTVSFATSSRSKPLFVTFGRVDQVSRPVDITLVPINWTEEMRALDGVLVQITPKPIDVILTKGMKIVEKRTSIRIASKPFSRGSFSLAYCALMETGHKMVAKKSIVDHDMSDRDVLLELKKKAIAHSLAQDFNSKLSKEFEWARINFIHSFLFRTKERDYLIEGFMDGEYTKKINNLDMADETQEIRHLTAFAHYSYEASGGHYLVTDFQGVNFLLTDPAVHTSTSEFSNGGDFGNEGFVAFFSKHVCNDLCKALALRRPEILTVPMEPWHEKEFAHPLEEPKKCKGRICNAEVKGEEFCKICQSRLGETITKVCGCKSSFSFKKYYYLLFALEDPISCEICAPRRLDLFG